MVLSSGAAHGALGDQLAKLTASDGAAGDLFGGSVSLSGDTALVGARSDDCPAGGGPCGSAYVYRFNGSSWVEEAKLTASDGAAGDFFGFSVSLSGDVALVGAAGDDCTGGILCGSAYLFDVGGDTDGDGLLDDWETNGIPYTDGGGIERRFMLPGADPFHKDPYIEVDAMTGLSLSDNAV
ncbi:MAG: FG-GAP repeat protein, partial [Planctomycetes bacterium]|nr:FG-GAP repeat protein [Planctomycetota bacterium]